jgi:hypothetical protein
MFRGADEDLRPEYRHHPKAPNNGGLIPRSRRQRRNKYLWYLAMASSGRKQPRESTLRPARAQVRYPRMA